VSRASSVSGKDKSNLSKRGKTGKQRKDDLEGFDSRSQYTAIFGTHHYGASQQSSWAPQYLPMGNDQFNGLAQQQPYLSNMPQPYPQSAVAYPQMIPQGQMGAYPHFGAMASVSLFSE
jgi:hypothetical protein